MLEFNILLTSFLDARKYDLKNKFSVASWKPEWCNYKNLDFLFPFDINGIRLRLRNCHNSIDEYINELRKGYEDRWELIEEWLQSLNKNEQYILCCWCPHSSSSKEQIQKYSTFFCHTTLIGKMLSLHRPDLITKLDYSREMQSVPQTIDWYQIKLKKIISGGQTGADQGGLKAAKEIGLETGGLIPKGFITQDGPRPEFQSLYNIREHISCEYPPRTFKNVENSDGTVRFATNFYSAGEKCTLKAIKEFNKPYFDVNLNEEFETQKINFVSWLKCNKIEILNVAGNSSKTSPQIESKVITFLKQALI